MKLDPFTVEVIRHGLSAAAEDEPGDDAFGAFAAAARSRRPVVCDHRCQGRSGRPGPGYSDPSRGDGLHCSGTAEKVLPVSGLNDGDVLIYNLGALGGNHLNDVKVVRPVFVDGDIVAFAISLAHWPDIGGTWPGSYFAKAIDTFQEAMRFHRF